MSLLESITRDLGELPEPSLVRVAHFIEGIRGVPAPSPEARCAALEGTSGCMAGREGEEFERAVLEAGGKFDAGCCEVPLGFEEEFFTRLIRGAEERSIDHAPDPELCRRVLKATAGCMAGVYGEEFERAVRAEADRIDADHE